MDGVPDVIDGNSGKAPAEVGGFIGWTLAGVSRSGLKAEIRPHVDALQVQAPQDLRIGKAETVAATLKQGSRTLPVKYPMGVVWEGSPGLHVGDASGLRPWHVAWLDPGTGLLTAIRPGQVEISARVNDVTSGAEIRAGLQEAA